MWWVDRLLGEFVRMTDNVLPITAVEFDPQNARKRTERSSYMIRESLQQFGPLRSLVGQRLPDGRIIVRAGNGTLEEAGQIGIDKVRVVERRPDELVVVVADDLDESKWKAYAVADNRASDASTWDVEILEEIHDEVDLSDWFTADEIVSWDMPDTPAAGEFEADEPDDDTPIGTGINGDRYPLAIVLDWKHQQLWQDDKDDIGVKGDKGAFLKMWAEWREMKGLSPLDI
jgi:hypothetical protein